MGSICTQWEAASSDSGIRTVFLRTGIILGKNDGPWEKLFQPYKYFVGGPLASGEQGFPWMHVDDWVSAVILCIENSSISGPVILTAPEAITMDQFSNAIAKGSGKPNYFRVPKFALNILLGEQSIIVWGGVFANPSVLKNAEFNWKFSDPVAAVKDLV